VFVVAWVVEGGFTQCSAERVRLSSVRHFGEEKANRGKCAKLNRTCSSERLVFGVQGEVSAEVLRVGEAYEV
jgi:hypothetical protein